MDKVRLFYHATTSVIKPKITVVNKLIPQVHNPNSEWMWLMDSKYKEEIPKGVWFCSTLFNGGLPTISPYGKERVSIPIENVFGQLGGNISLYHGKDSQVNANNYVRLMLVKDGDNFECLKHMEKIDPSENDWLKCISDSEFEVAKRPDWVEVFCPYAIDVTDGEWDTV